MNGTQGEWFTLYDGESGKTLFDRVAHDCIMELSSPGPKDEEVDYWINEVTPVASVRDMRSYVKRSGVDIRGKDDDDIRRYALWLAACDYRDGLDGWDGWYDDGDDDDE